MAVWCNSAGDAIRRTSGIAPSNADYTASWWVRRSADTPAAGVFRAIFLTWVPGWSHYVWIGTDQGTNHVVLEAFNGALQTSVATIVPLPDRPVGVPMAYVRQGTAHRLYVDGQLAATVTLDVSGTAFTETWLGEDGSSTSFPDLGFAQLKEWSGVALTLEELRREWSTATAVRATNLWSAAPLETDLLDGSGNGRDWSAVSTPSFLPMALPAAEAPGWSLVAAGSVATGTTDLTITKPAGTEDGHILLMLLAHQGADWAVVPAGWTLVAREIHTLLRGELYWKRAAAEGASYAVSGLATAAAGVIVTYDGGPDTGSPVDVAAVVPFTTNLAGQRVGTNVVTTQDEDLVLLAVATVTNSAHISQGTVATLDGQPTEDIDLQTVPIRVQGGTSGARVVLHDAIKAVAGDTGVFRLSGQTMTDAVLFTAAFTRRATLQPVDTRLYLTKRPTPWRALARLRGRWDSTADTVQASRREHWTYQLRRAKTSGGALATRDARTNQQGNWDLLIARFVFGPLQAQDLAGTVRLVWRVSTYWNDRTLGAVDLSTVRTKMHLYVSKGESLEPRALLLDQNIGSVTWPFNIHTVVQLSGTLTPATAEEGDYLVVELGVRVAVSPTPEPVWNTADQEFTQLDITGLGATNITNATTHNGVPYPDPTVGASSGTQIPLLEFSQVIQLAPELVEAQPIPAHSSPAAAVTIARLPFAADRADTTRVPAPQRQLWWRYTATETGRLIATVLGANHLAQITLYTGDTADALTRVLFPLETSSVIMSVHRALATLVLEVEAGTTYWFRVRSAMGDPAAASSGGSTRFTLSKVRAPRVDDIVLPTSRITCVDECGHIANMTSAFAALQPTAAVIDYSQLPLASLATPGTPHTAIRLLVGIHNGRLVEILDYDTLNIDEPEVDFFSDAWDDPGGGAERPEKVASLSLDGQARLLVGWFGSGYLFFSGLEGNPSVFSAESEFPLESALRRMALAQADNQAGAPFPPAPAWSPPAQRTVAWFVAVDPDDDDVIWYTSGGFYAATCQRGTASPDLRCDTIRRFSLTTGQPLDDFATVPLDASRNPGLRGFQLLPNGKGLLVANGARVDYLNAAGRVVRSFHTPEDDLASLVDVRLTAEGRELVAWCLAQAALYRWNFSSGGLVHKLDTFLATGQGTQIALYQPNGITLCW